jgi:hypothetical protein
VPLLFPGIGSDVAEEIVAVFVIEPPAPASTLTTSVKTALPGVSDAIEQDTVPFDPIAGVVHDQPAGEVKDTNVVPAGSVSDIATVEALLGPALLTVIVYVRFVPGVTGSGASVFVTDRSA